MSGRNTQRPYAPSWATSDSATGQELFAEIYGSGRRSRLAKMRQHPATPLPTAGVASAPETPDLGKELLRRAMAPTTGRALSWRGSNAKPLWVYAAEKRAAKVAAAEDAGAPHPSEYRTPRPAPTASVVIAARPHSPIETEEGATAARIAEQNAAQVGGLALAIGADATGRAAGMAAGALGSDCCVM